MKKTFLTVMLMITTIFTTTSFAQKQTLHQQKFMDNIYVGLSTGFMFPTTDLRFSTIRPEFALEIGKALSPYYTMGAGIETSVNTTGVKTAFDMVEFNWIHKLNVLNLFSLQPQRNFEIYTVAELGAVHTMVETDWYASTAFGVEAEYHLNKHLTLTAKPQIEYHRISDGLNVNKSNLNLLVGVKYTFGKRSYDVCREAELTNSINTMNAVIEKMKNDYNEAIAERDENKRRANDLEAEVSTLKDSIDNHVCNADTVYDEVTPTIGFAIGSAEILPQFDGHLQKIAEAYKGKQIVVQGFADKATGSEQLNMRLSAKRAEAVKAALVKYGCNEEDIDIEPLGDTVQMFKTNHMNRTAILLRK